MQADIEQIRRLKARGLLNSQIAEVVGITPKRVGNILKKVYSLNPSLQFLDELDVLRQQYDEIFFNPSTNAMIRIECINQKANLVMKRWAIMQQKNLPEEAKKGGVQRKFFVDSDTWYSPTKSFTKNNLSLNAKK